MATITSAQAGNWSDTSTWLGGVVPVNGDGVILNHSVTLNVDIDGITFLSGVSTAGLIVNSTRNITNFNAVAIGTLNGVIRTSGTNTSHTLNITGSIEMTGGGASNPFINTSSSAIRLIATGVFLNTGANNRGALINNGSTASIIEVYGVANQGPVGSIVSSTGGSFKFDGVLNGGGSTAFALGTGLSSCEIKGVCTNNSLTTVLITNNPRTSVSGVFSDSVNFPVFTNANFRVIDGEDVQFNLYDTANNTRPMYTAGLLTGYPLESKVEDGTVYGPSSEFEGTMEPWDAAFAQALATAQRDLQLPSILSAITAP